MTTTIQFRTKAQVKKDAQKVLAALGLDLSTALNVYLVKVIQTKGIPFQMVTENGMTIEKELEILREIAAVKRSKKSYATVEEAHRAILGK